MASFIDGEADQIATLSSNSGFLALDKNGDGVVNDGSELFGPATGSGFAELAQYDGDGNHWIDENDSIFAHLRIWSRDAAGNNSLLTLGEVGIGAIYLGNVATQFDLKTASAELLGQIQSSGIYLKEDGTAGTVQELDLVA